MKKSLLTAAFLLLCAPLFASAQVTYLNVYQTVDINLPATQVWDLVKGWNNLHGWHPAFISTELVSGENNTPSSVRKITLKDGPSFDEELLQFNNQMMMMQYRIIGENALPIQDYNAMIGVTPLGLNQSMVVWRAMYRSKPGQKDDANLALVNGLFRAGLDALKAKAEAR